MQESNFYMPRLRTLPKAIEEIKKADPDTAMTMRALRRMVNTGEIPTVAVNSKKLINLDLLFKHISCCNTDAFRVANK